MTLGKTAIVFKSSEYLQDCIENSAKQMRINYEEFVFSMKGKEYAFYLSGMNKKNLFRNYGRDFLMLIGFLNSAFFV
jgi:hypothetical protein